MRKNRSRRDFLKAAALAGGALTLSGCGNGGPPASAVSPALFTAESASTARQPAQPPADTLPPPPEYLPRIEAGGATVALPAPRSEGGMPLMRALALRSSQRTYGREEMELHALFEMLWAASGVNRPSRGLRTAPSAVNTQDIEIYLCAEKGLFRYDPEPHALQAVSPDDLRTLTGTQSFAGQAPVVLVYVSDYGKLRGLSGLEYGDLNIAWSWIHTGFISQNVYLFCASEGLSTVVRAMVNRTAWEEKMGLESMKHVTMVQSVGYSA
jgi:SagB-type dehydrogenase family enzyme